MELDVTYSDGEPEKVTYHSMVYGLMKFHIDGETAVVDDKWGEIEANALADGFDQKVRTEDVVEAVQKLPFVAEVVR